MFTIRQILVRMRQGDRDREIARSGLMGRKKLGVLRHQAALHDWLDLQQPLPDDGELAVLQHQRKQAVPNQCVSTLKEH
ncbi:IS21 family transposase, partial [Acidithiobacillus ferrooxidans]|nr:IS21 family transposase [Acidithiobacillus ferrooxidans]